MKTNWNKYIEMYYNSDYSMEDVCKTYNLDRGSSIKVKSFQSLLSKNRGKRKEEEEERSKCRRVGVIGDLHIPFSKKGYLQFCYDTFKKWDVDTIVMIGDLVDNHAISRFNTEVDAEGGWSEYSEALYEIEKMKIMFPELYLTIGNHDRIPQRQAATLGLHDGFIKSFEEAWKLPEEWKVDTSFVIDDVLYTHGLGSGGINGTLNTAINRQMSLVVGHKHSCSGVRYSASIHNLIFGMDVGCGIDVDRYAFRYGRDMVRKPVLSCGIIIGGRDAFVVAMGEKYFGQ